MSIDIAIIDSGINAGHPHVGRVAGGLALGLDQKGQMWEHTDFSDTIGHGTAIAGVIRYKIPHAQIHAVKIFNQSLEASSLLLTSALLWAVDQNFKIIHLSLGTKKEDMIKELDRICLEFQQKGTVIIASAGSPDDRIFPAAFKSVIGVYWNRSCDESTIIYHPEKPIEFGAYGYPRELPGLPRDKNFYGHSFAAAHITAKAARLLEEYPEGDVYWVKNALAQKAIQQKSL